MSRNYNSQTREGFSVMNFFVRLLTGSVVLALTAALTPGFTITGVWPLLISAVVLAALDYGISSVGAEASPFGKGLTGFLLAAGIIYLTQFLVSGYSVTLTSALIGAVIYGVVDAIIPGKGI